MTFNWKQSKPARNALDVQPRSLNIPLHSNSWHLEDPEETSFQKSQLLKDILPGNMLDLDIMREFWIQGRR